MIRSDKWHPLIQMAPLLLVDTLVFVLQKTACRQAEHSLGNFYLSLASQPLLWFALVLALVQLYLWTRILRDVDLALAYPLSSLSAPMTMLVSQLLLHENLEWPVWLGALMILLGVIFISSDPAANAPGELPEPVEDAAGV